MKLNAYSLYDRKSLSYHPPFYQAADGAAVRMVQDLVDDRNTSVGRHPSDFVLYCVGIYDDQNASFMSHSPIIHVMDASSLVKVQKEFFTFDGPTIRPNGAGPTPVATVKE